MSENEDKPEDKKTKAKPSADRIVAAKAAAAKVKAGKATEMATSSVTEAKPTVKAAVKEKEPLKDNGDGTITDPSTGYMWKKSDAWLDTHKFYTWFDHHDYVEKMNSEKFAGFDNWRIPSKSEAVSIHAKDKECMDKNGTPYFIDPIFASGGAGNTWIQECSEDKIVRFDWKTGIDTAYPSKDVWASMRLIRIEGEVAQSVAEANPPQSKESSKPEELTADTSVKTAAVPAKSSAVEKPKSGGVKGPTPKKNYTPEMKADILKRAKAYAAKVKAEKGG